MARRPLLLRAVRRGLRLADRPLSIFEVRASGLSLRSHPTFAERQVLEEIGWLLRRPGTVVYDIGAATGVYTVAAARVSTVRRVVAFEPLADSFAALLRRAAAHPTVRCLNLALGDENRHAEIQRSTWRNASSFLPVGDVTRAEFPAAAELEVAEAVQVARLDDLVSEHRLELPDIVKMDVQGYEDRVIGGGAATIRNARACVVELSFRPLYDGAPLFEDIYQLLVDLGFRFSGFASSYRGSDGSVLFGDGVFERS